MRPLIVLSGLADGGAERVALSFLERSAARGMPVAACTLTSRNDGTLAREMEEHGLRRHDLGARRLLDPLAALRFVRLIRRERFDLVHAHGQDAAILAIASRPLHGARVVITRHALDEPAGTRRERGRGRAALWALRHADARVAVSRAAASRLADLLGVESAGIRVIFNGVALDAVDPARRDAIRSSLGLESGDVALLALAVLREGKGHEVLLDAMPALLQRVPRARLLVAGGGPMEAALRERARSLGRAAIFLGPRSDVPEILAASDIVVLPSLAEALPTALMEAACAGRPVVATNVGGVPEVVEAGVTGLLVPAGDAPALATALARLAGQPDLRSRMGEAGRERAARLFSLDVHVDATWALWRDVAPEGEPE